MSGDELVVNTASLREDANDFDTIHQKVQTAYSNLNSSLNSIGQSWGHDKFGQLLDKDYGNGKDDQLKGLEALTNMLEMIPQALRGVAKHLEDAERVARGE